MNCPSCGLPTLPDQKFCRSCGAGLQMTTQRLVENVAVSDPGTRPATVRNERRSQPTSPALWGLLLMFIGVAVAVIGKMLIHANVVTVVGVLVSLAGMFLLAYSSLSPPHPKEYHSIPTSKPEVLTQTEAPKSLSPGNADYVPAVTERTTDLLNHPAPTSQSQKPAEKSQV